MQTVQIVLLVVQIFVSLALVGIILLQRSEGSGLVSSSTGSPSAFMSARGTANLLTRTTAVLAALFIALNLALAILAGNHGQGASLLDQLPAGPAVPAPASTGSTPPGPAVPAPTVPLSGANDPGIPFTSTHVQPGTLPPAPAGNVPALHPQGKAASSKSASPKAGPDVPLAR